jgi:hypothetical protein
MEEKTKHSGIGIASIILGALGLIIFLIGFLIPCLYTITTGLIFAVIALILGYIAKKQGDNYGNYGIMLGVLTLIIAFIILLLTTVTTVEISYYN